ncbi:site-specific integrase [Salinimonas marina]|uniref:Site-specific integrase n=1 Tax=Salinimonas marina TaxID=2785918 RepID=A0A7S9E009_9ALTE|nr:site-specific integrase [Salinimonas marina]QPG06520.1 site-specific integrase [Salinimonas marina]
MALTDIWLRKNNGRLTAKEELTSDTGAMFARLRGGKISFIYRPYLQSGERIKMTLGSYPKMSLKDARDKRDEYNRMVNEGHDPRRKLMATRFTNATQPTVNELFTVWYENQAMVRKKNPALHLRTYELHLKKEFGNMNYVDLPRVVVGKYLVQKANEVPHIALRIISDMKACINYAKIHGLTDAENVFQIFTSRSLGISRSIGKRVLSGEELRLMYKTLDSMDMNEKNLAIVNLMLFYGCRGAEIRETRKDWLNFETMTWTVPPEFHKTGGKTGKPLVRPILDEMKHLWEILLAFSGDSQYVCTLMASKNKKTDKQMSANALRSIAGQIINHAVGHFKDAQGEPITWEHWTNHDLRRTARSHWSEFGDWAVCEKMLGHSLPGEADVYDHNQYMGQMRAIYRQWWNQIQEYAGETNVVQFEKASV